MNLRAAWQHLRRYSAEPSVLLGCLMLIMMPTGTAAEDLDLSFPVQTCRNLTPSHLRPSLGRHLAAIPLRPRPDKGVPHLDPVHGSCILRVTDHQREPPHGFARADHSRHQAFNADDSRLLVAAQDGRWHVYDARTLRHQFVLPALEGESAPQWHPTKPELIYYLPRQGNNMRLLELDVRSGTTRTVADFTSRLTRLWPRAAAVRATGQGAPSAEGRYWAFLVDDKDELGLGMFTWDLQADRIIATYDLASHGVGRPQHLGMSPSGRHVVVAWRRGITAFTREWTLPYHLPGRSEHFDLARTPQGDDVYVNLDLDSSGSPLFMVNMRTQQRTDLFQTYQNGTVTALHVSGRAHLRPGWVLVSTHAERGKGIRQWLHRRLMAVELKANPRIVHLAFHRSRPGTYWATPHALVNRDFTRVLFNSNWGSSNDLDIDAYLVVLRADLLPSSGAHR